MQKLFYPIFKLPDYYIRDYQKQELPLWVKWWLLGKAGRELSEILTGSEFTLLHTLNKKFKILQLNGKTEQTQLSGKNLFDIGTQKSDYSNQAIINDFIENGVKLNVVDYGNTVSYRLQSLEGNKQYTITATSSIVKGRFYVRIRSLDDSRWLNNDDINLQAYGWTYISGYNGWYLTFNSITMSKVITIPECLYWQLGLGFESASSIVGTIQSISNIQLEQGTTASSYEPYCRTEYLAQIQTSLKILKM